MRIKQLFVVCLIISGCVGRVDNNNVPMIKIESPISFKSIELTDTVKFFVPISNIGNDELIIDYLNVPCGCLADYSFDFKKLDPGETDSIMFNYSPIRSGYVEENILIYFVGFVTPIHFVIKGVVKKTDF